VLIARRAGLLAELAGELATLAPSRAVVLDLADTGGIGPAFAEIIGRDGPPGVLINCAGYGIYKRFLDHTPDELDRLMRVNHDAAAAAVRAVLPSMLAARTGHIVAVCSMSARMGPWGHAGYAASKAAMRSLMESLAADYPARETGVRFTTVYPGIVRTPYFQGPTMDRLWERVGHRGIPAERVAAAIAGTIGKDRLSVYVPRHYRALDLIAGVSPRLAHRLVRNGSRPERVPLAACPPECAGFGSAGASDTGSKLPVAHSSPVTSSL
jgi:short-subunit dehydrogenase